MIGRRKIKRRRSRETRKCYFCDKPGHKPGDCPAKDTGKLLAKKKFAHQILTLPALTPEDIYTLRNKAPPIADTLREVQDYYDNIDEYTDDEDWLEHPNNQENLENGALLSSKKRDFECLMGDEINSDDDDDYKDVSTFPATSLLPPPSVDSADYPQKGLCN